jgi:hypothetical protein
MIELVSLCTMALGYDEIDVPTTPFESPYVYVQSVARATLTTDEGEVLEGTGSFEVLSRGPNANRGFTGWNDGA